MHRLWYYFKKGIKDFLRNTAAAPAIFAVVICIAIAVVSQNVRILYINDNGNNCTLLSRRSESIDSVLARSNITLDQHDVVLVDTNAPIFQEIRINRGNKASLIVDGMEYSYSFRTATVQDMLDHFGIQLTNEDYCSASENQYLGDGDVVTITRVTRNIIKKTVTIPYETVTKYSSVLNNGKTKVAREGENGSAEQVWEELWSNGECIGELLISSKEITPASDELVVKGKSGVAVSRLDFSDEYPLDENGIPINYVKCYSGEHATGYSAKNYAFGSSGGYCYYGTCAARPSKYPYGTKLYVRSSSGYFVYGYVIVNDTGTFAKYDRVNLDLFYETYYESCWNGYRTVDVYVLEWGSGKRY